MPCGQPCRATSKEWTPGLVPRPALEGQGWGVGREVVNRLVATVPGQHVALFTEDMQAFYAALGFQRQWGGMSQVIGSWLGRG
jgi:hypothetical protein